MAQDLTRACPRAGLLLARADTAARAARFEVCRWRRGFPALPVKRRRSISPSHVHRGRGALVAAPSSSSCVAQRLPGYPSILAPLPGGDRTCALATFTGPVRCSLTAWLGAAGRYTYADAGARLAPVPCRARPSPLGLEEDFLIAAASSSHRVFRPLRPWLLS